MMKRSQAAFFRADMWSREPSGAKILDARCTGRLGAAWCDTATRFEAPRSVQELQDWVSGPKKASKTPKVYIYYMIVL